MIDIHCHILPGIDDGAKTMSESMQMAEIAAADGISTIIATPHARESADFARRIREDTARLNEQLTAAKVPIHIVPGADVPALFDPSLLKHFTIDGGSHILLEFPHSHLPQNASGILFTWLVWGFKPIITHPERNPSIMRKPELLLDLLQSNIGVQITADSLVGNFGPDSEACAVYLLRKGVVTYIASDAHSARQRLPVLQNAVDAAAKIIGLEKALQLVSSNPRMLLSGDRTHD